MKLHYLGTAAAERVPGIFCNCRICEYARLHGGKELRTQTQTILDDGDLLIDFPGDSYQHMQQYQLRFQEIEHLLLTHWHSDHLYAEDLAYRMSPYANQIANQLMVYGSRFTKTFFDRAFELEGMTEPERINYQILEPFQKYVIGPYTVHALPAEHGLKKGDCLIFVIQREGKSIFYTHDTGYPSKSVLDYLRDSGIYLDLISLDCTGQGLLESGSIHMNLLENQRLVDQLQENGNCDEKTRLVVNHFSHNGGSTHLEMEKLAAEKKMTVAFDGMIVHV